jgi:hydrogenase maturation protease
MEFGPRGRIAPRRLNPAWRRRKRALEGIRKETMTAEILIFGYGNPSRGDDALGPMLLESLDRRLAGGTRRKAGGIEFLTDFQLQVEHALDLADRRLVLFADAHSSCPPPWMLAPLRAADDPTYTTHALSPPAVLHVYRRITGSEPPPGFLLGIRGYRFELGESLSDGARANLDAAVDLALDLCAHPRPEYWNRLCASGVQP